MKAKAQFNFTLMQDLNLKVIFVMKIVIEKGVPVEKKQ